MLGCNSRSSQEADSCGGVLACMSEPDSYVGVVA